MVTVATLSPVLILSPGFCSYLSLAPAGPRLPLCPERLHFYHHHPHTYTHHLSQSPARRCLHPYLSLQKHHQMLVLSGLCGASEIRVPWEGRLVPCSSAVEGTAHCALKRPQTTPSHSPLSCFCSQQTWPPKVLLARSACPRLT